MKIKLTRDLSFDCVKQTVWVNGTEHKLTIKETELLNLLVINKNRLTKRKDTLEEIWINDTRLTTGSMYVYITKLRKILEPLANVRIVNVYRRGYRLIIDKSK